MARQRTLSSDLLSVVCGICAPFKFWDFPGYPIIGGIALMTTILSLTTVVVLRMGVQLKMTTFLFVGVLASISSYAVCLLVYAQHFEVVTRFVSRERSRLNLPSCFCPVFPIIGLCHLSLVAIREVHRLNLSRCALDAFKFFYFCATPHSFCSLLKFFMALIDEQRVSLKIRPTELFLVRSINRHREILLTTQATVDAFGLHNLCTTVNCFLHAISYAYKSVTIFEDTRDLIPTATYFLISVLQLAIMLSLCHFCQKLNKKAGSYNIELFHMMQLNKELCNNEKLQLFVTMKQKVTFSACGFFDLGYPLVTSIIAALTSYLVILLQVRES